MTNDSTTSDASREAPTGDRGAAGAARPAEAPEGAGAPTSSLVKLGHEEWSELCSDLESWVDE